MNTQKHTPGPWQFGHVGTDALWIGPDYNQTPVAHVDHDMEYARDNSRANARLISAAPDMLGSGKALADRECRYEGNNIVIPCGSHGEAIKLMADLRAAIRKAEGGAS